MEHCLRCNQKLWRKRQLFCSPRCRYKYYHNSDLILPIKRQWFEMILLGIKKEEYREIKPYWEKRFSNYFHQFYNTQKVKDKNGTIPQYIWSPEKKDIIFRNGYQKDAPEFTAECTISEGFGRTEWGAVEGERYYILSIHRIIGMKNCKITGNDKEEVMNKLGLIFGKSIVEYMKDGL